MKQFIIIFSLLVLFVSCNHREDPTNIKVKYPPIGALFEGESLILQFVDSDAIRWFGISSPSLDGFGKYTYINDTLKIINPYGVDDTGRPVSLPYDEVKDAYFIHYTGVFTEPDRLETVNMSLVGVKGQAVYNGTPIFHRPR